MILPYIPFLLQITAPGPLDVVLQPLQMTALTGDSHNIYSDWSRPTVLGLVCFSLVNTTIFIPEKAWTRAVPPETPPRCSCRTTSHRRRTPAKPRALSLMIAWITIPQTTTFQENTDLALIDSQYPVQGQRVAQLAPQGGEQAATSHQVKPTTKGEGRAWSAQALLPQLVSVIFRILACCQNATTVQLGTAHLRHWPSFPQLPLQRSACACLTAHWRQAPPGTPEEQLLTDF